MFWAALAVLTFGDTALNAGIERITREEGHNLWLPLESLIVSVVIYECLESGVSSHRFS